MAAKRLTVSAPRIAPDPSQVRPDRGATAPDDDCLLRCEALSSMAHESHHGVAGTFATRTVKQSYAVEHVMQKESGTAAVLTASARRSIVAGIGLLGLGGIMLAFSVAAGDAPRLANLPLIMGVIFLGRGLRLRRRRQTLDANSSRN